MNGIIFSNLEKLIELEKECGGICGECKNQKSCTRLIGFSTPKQAITKIYRIIYEKEHK